MRCADCILECVGRSPLGGCPNGEAVEHTVIFTPPDTKPVNLGNGQWDKGYEPADATKALEDKNEKDWKTVFEFMNLVNLIDAASDLVDAVERYMRQACLRSELAMKKDKLKALLNESV